MRKKPNQSFNTRAFFFSLLRFPLSILVFFGRPFYYACTFLLLYIYAFSIISVPTLWEQLKQKIPKKGKVPRKPPELVLRFPSLSPSALLRGTPTVMYSGIAAIFMLTALTTFSYFYIFKDLPSPKELITRKQILTTKIYDRNHVVLYKMFKDENRTLVPLSTVPIPLQQATIAIEDKDFYAHGGFSLRGIARAMVANIQGKKIEGGSTITQQLIKNTLLTPEKTLRRKIREVILSVMVEAMVNKEKILEMYFNEVSYGGSVYGVEEASRRYFDKSVRDLSLAESAYLAGLPQAPSAFSPFGPTPELGFTRQQQVLQRMVEDGYITQEHATKASEEKLVFRADINDIKAPHFVMYVRDLLAKQFGEDTVSQGGLEVVTTLDYGVQQAAEKAVDQEMARVQRFHITNGATLVTNPKDGEILAMVGSRNYFDIARDGQVNVTIRPRQPGSSIKPLTYATAFEHGFTPSTILDDSPVTYTTIGSPPYSPKNYDGAFHGKVPVRIALASSYNIPAVKTLATIGIKTVVEKAREMGITTWEDQRASQFGLSLTLGGGEVKMTDMAMLYGTFANNGMSVPLNPFLLIKNAKGEVLYKNPCPADPQTNPCGGKRSLDPRIAYQITNILADNAARAPTFGMTSVLAIQKQQVAVKTGTTNSMRDNWTLGYTTNRLVAVWVGNNDNSPMSYVASGITGASPIWNAVMRSLLDETRPHTFGSAPDGLIKKRICVPTGTLSCQACPVQRDDYFILGTEPKTACKNETFAPPEQPPADGTQNQTPPTPQPRNIQPLPRNTILDGATTGQ